jgi:hypothetical protein
MKGLIFKKVVPPEFSSEMRIAIIMYLWSVPRESWTGNKNGKPRVRVTSARREWAPPRLVGAG